uniref:DDE Tnp4 domain-containing protein n=1 Tax=Tanacetum cinerariifolium TaxID=118510 RepID=A0A699HH58_TANCI|nr:hypothetical protein [Tanacetum cinerariifolium]
MKRDYNLWKSLKNGETGLGWNAIVQKLDCADEWWKIKIKEVHNENAEDEDVESDDDLNDTQKDTQVGLPWILKKGRRIKKLHFRDILLDMISDTDIIAEYYFKHMCKEPCMTSQQKGEDWMKDVLNGSAHDTRVFLHTINTQAMNFPKPPKGKYYLVDKGYPKRNRYLVPYSKTRYHQSRFQNEPPTNMKEAFNRSHSSLRIYNERSFGILKKRWKLLGGMP